MTPPSSTLGVSTLLFVSPVPLALPCHVRAAPSTHPRRPRIRASAHQRPPKPSLFADADDQEFELPDFDRDYYDELKEEYKDEPLVDIYSRHDYTLDPKDAPHLFENRGRDMDVIRESVRKRVEAHYRRKGVPVPDPLPQPDQWEDEDCDEDGLPPTALLWTDLHTDEELRTMEARARICDLSNGRMWSSPMTAEEIEQAKAGIQSEDDDNWDVNFRPSGGDDDDDEKEESQPVMPLGDDTQYWGDGPMPDGYLEPDMTQAAFDELQDSWDKLHTHPPSVRDPEMRPGESVPTPDRDEYARWRQEALKRGGNATLADSHFLSPYGDHDAREPPLRLPPSGVPPQHCTLVRVHVGEWVGTAAIFSLHGATQPALIRRVPVHSDLSTLPDGSLHASSSFDTDDEELLCDTVLSSAAFGNGLVPGRAVGPGGTYICVPAFEAERAHGLSVPLSTLSRLVADDDLVARSAVEIGLPSTPSGDRHRIILLSEGAPQRARDDESKPTAKKKHPFLYAVVLSERKGTHLDVKQVDQRPPSLPRASLVGTWADENALLLQPEYVPEGARIVHSQRSVRAVAPGSLTETDVSTAEDETRRAERQAGKKKVSKRVAAARAYDRHRLADCSLVCTETVGDVSPQEVHAWTVHGTDDDEDGVTRLVSPRLGRFVDDYAALVVADGVVMSFPTCDAFPSTWSTVSVTQCAAGNTRSRVVAGRSGEGVLVGALFATEVPVQDGNQDESTPQ